MFGGLAQLTIGLEFRAVLQSPRLLQQSFLGMELDGATRLALAWMHCGRSGQAAQTSTGKAKDCLGCFALACAAKTRSGSGWPWCVQPGRCQVMASRSMWNWLLWI